MEKPDADGFVTIKWPSKSVPFGGVFHSRVPEPTSNSQEFLKVLLNESKLSVAQRQKSSWENRLRQEEPPSEQPQARREVLVRPRTSQRRSQSAIRASGVYDSDGQSQTTQVEDTTIYKEMHLHSLGNTTSELKVHRHLAKIKT